MHATSDSATIDLHALYTELQRLRVDYREAQRELAELKEAVVARDAFIATAGHELRNAMGGILVAATSLRFGPGPSGELPPGVAKRLDSIARQARSFVRRATTLLDVSRLTTGGPRLHRVPVNLTALVLGVIDELGPEAERAGCALAGPEKERIVGCWDREAIEQVAVNLLSNAIKYGAGRPIEVSVTLEGTHAALKVRDHGLGISQEDRVRIFGRFERAVRRADLPGFGMGLWIAQQLVHAHGGEIDVQSEPGRGSLFTVRLPGGIDERQ
jgi:two-component system, OmpR family, sensor kinase